MITFKLFRHLPTMIFGALLVLFCACQQINQPAKVEAQDEYDRPDEAALFQIMRTHDPSTGEVPSEKMWAAITQTKIQKDALLNSNSFVSALTWVERGSNSDAIGPSNGNTRANNDVTSGRIDAIWVDIADVTGKTVWVGGRGGGLWKTTDITVSPANWISVNDYMINLSIAAITQDPTNTDVMYLCTGESFGESGALRGNGVFKSTDHGVNWSLLSSTNNSTYYYCTRILCDYQGNIYVGTRSGLFRSTKVSGGNAWTDISPSGISGQISDLEISSTTVSGRLHVICGLSGTLSSRYTDNALTVTSGSWTSPATALPSSNRRGEIAVSGNVLYCLPGNNSSPSQAPTVYKSTDGGANWASAGSTPSSAGSIPFANGQGWYNLTVAINPADAAQCIVGGIDNAKTTAGGSPWTRISGWYGTTGQYAHADQHGSVWYDNGNKLILANDGGIFFSDDGGATIRDRNVGLRLKQFYSVAIHPSTTNYFLTGAQDNGTHQFYNAGLSSSVEAFGGDGGYVAVDQDEPQYQIGTYIYSNYRRSTNSGNTWIFPGTDDNNGLFINPYDYDDAANRVYASYSSGNYMRWSNPQSGFTFTSVPITAFGGQKAGAVFVSPYVANRVFFGMASGGKIIRVDNADGGSPTAVDITDAAMPTGSVYMNCINTGSSSQFLVATYSNYGTNNIWVSTNAGSSWVNVDGNLPDMPVYWATFHPDNSSKMFIATETGVWETDLLNAGSTVWTANNSFPTARATMLQYRSSDRTLAASTYGRGLWTSVIPAVTTPDIQFQTATANATESTTVTSGCRGYNDYTYNMVILNPPTGSGSAVATLSIAGGGTALQAVDFDITTNGSFVTPSMQLSFPVGSNPPQPFTVRVYDDAAVEANETFTLTYSLLAGSTNAQVGSSNQSFVFTINDNDAAPVTSSSGSYSVGTYNANLSASSPLKSTLIKHRIQVLYTAAELIAAGITSSSSITSMNIRVVSKGSTQPYIGMTISMGNTSATNLSTGFISPSFTTVYSANFSSVVGDNTFTFSTTFTWNGSSNVVVQYCYDNAPGTPDAAIDVVEGNSAPLGALVRASTYADYSVGATAGCSLPAAFISDFRVNATFGVTVSGTAFSTGLNNTSTQYLGPYDDVYFYDGSGAILARVKNLTAFDYGCTQVEIDRAGSSTAQFWNATPSNYLASKSIKVVPTNNTTSGSYEITMYYSTAEVNGFNAAATPATFATSQIVKISNGFYIPDVTPASPHFSDAYVKPAAAAAFGSTGNTITASFSNTGFSGFGIGTPGNSLLTADYRSKANGNFSDGTKWEYNIFGANYIDANQAPTSGSTVLIQSGHAISLDASQIIGSGKTLTISGQFNAETNQVSGAGGFTLTAGATLSSSNTGSNGISQNITVTGTKTFADGANYTFLGNTTAPFGSLFTTVKPNNMVAAANITLDKPVYITGALGFTGSSRTLNTGGNLTMGSSLSGTARVADLTKDFFTAAVISGNNISGTATVERFIGDANKRAWRLLSGIPVGGSQTIRDAWQEGGSMAGGYGTWLTSTLYSVSNGFDATNNNLSSIITHNQGGGAGPSWSYNLANTNSTALSANPAYMLFVRGDRTMNATNGPAYNSTTLRANGTLNQGSQTAVTVSSTGIGYTLLGNPYASPIDLENILTTANLSQFFYVWDATIAGSNGVGGWRLVQKTGAGIYTSTPATGNNNSLRYIHSGQGFFLKASGSDASVVINETNKAASLSVINPLNPVEGDQQIYTELVSVGPVNQESVMDGVRVWFNAGFNANTADDINKIGNFGENISSFREGKKWIVELRPMIMDRDTIFLRTSNLGIKDYRLKINTIDFVQATAGAWLQDTWLNTNTSLNLTGSVTNIDFNVTANPSSANPDRFRIVFVLNGPLAVNFTSVKAILQGSAIAVDWKVSNQLNINKYVVEKSTDGLNFVLANTQPATIANNGDAIYNWLDLNPVTGDNFYRIRSVGNSGDIKISRVVKVNVGKANPGITIYPNPVLNGMISLELRDMEKGVYRLLLINNSGQTVDRQQLNFSGGSGTLPLSLPENIAAGNYIIICIKPDNLRVVKKLVIR